MIHWKNKSVWKVILIILAIFLISIPWGKYENKYYGSGKNKIQAEAMPIPEESQRILVFSPHPDDETIAAGGYLNMADQAGALVHVVLVTDGNKHGLEKQRYQEFHKATACLGIDQQQLEFWGYPDGALNKSGKSLNRKIRQAIVDFKPAIILYPHPRDHHADHAKLGSVVEKELRELARTGQQYQTYRYLVHYWLYPRPILDKDDKLVQPGSVLGTDQKWRQFELSKQEKTVKQKALHEYKTQLKNPFLRPLLVEFIRNNELFAQYTAE